jgi:hypothetical protein
MTEIEGHHMPDDVGYLLGLNRRASVSYVDGRDRHSAFCAILADSTGCGLDWLNSGNARFRGEGIGDGLGAVDVGIGAQHGVHSPNTNVQVYVLKTEWCIVAHRASVFPRLNRKKR